MLQDIGPSPYVERRPARTCVPQQEEPVHLDPVHPAECIEQTFVMLG